jgi:hypothetical protein
VKLRFPTDRIVGKLDWPGAWEAGGDGPVLATGSITVPDDVDIGLEVAAFASRERASGGGWRLLPDNEHPAVRLDFLLELPRDSIRSLSLRRIVPDTFGAVRHLAAGLERLYIAHADVGDEVLADVAALTNLTYLQTFGNHFTDSGVQVLVALQNLTSLYLEEETLTAAAFAFVRDLARLERLGLHDVPISKRQRRDLQRQFPNIQVG